MNPFQFNILFRKQFYLIFVFIKPLSTLIILIFSKLNQLSLLATQPRNRVIIWAGQHKTLAAIFQVGRPPAQRRHLSGAI